MRASLVRRLLGAAAAALLAACTENPVSPPSPVPSSPLEITTDRAAYTAGDLVIITFHNPTDARVGINLCAEFLERWSDRGWERLDFGPFVSCDAALQWLNPGASIDVPHRLQTLLTSGTYRLFYPGLLRENDPLEDHASSRPFAVSRR